MESLKLQRSYTTTNGKLRYNSIIKELLVIYTKQYSTMVSYEFFLKKTKILNFQKILSDHKHITMWILISKLFVDNNHNFEDRLTKLIPKYAR